MDTNIAVTGISPRELPRLQIPVIDISGNGGLGYSDLADPLKGVALFADILFSTALGDYVELFWAGAIVQNFDVNQGHLDSGVISFSVLPALIPDSPPDAEIYYRLTTRQGGNQDESPRRNVLVKRNIPGNPDPDNTTPVINENLSPPQGVPVLIDEEQDLTLTIAPWPIMNIGDVLTLYWGGSRYAFRNPPLTETQVNQPQKVTVLAQTLIDAGDSASLIVNYEIRDVVNNWSLYSLPALTEVQLDPNAPGAPRVVEADPLTHEIDLTSLGSNDVNVLIPPIGINPLDIITLHWLGQTDEGTPVVPTIPPQPVDQDGFMPTFEVLNADVVAIASGSARVYYDVQPNARRSKSVTVAVVGQPVQLAAPAVDGAVGDAIDPTIVPAVGATVRIKPYAAKGFGDEVILLWEGEDAIGTPLVYTAQYSVGRDEELDDVTFLVPKSKLDPLSNGSLTLTYTVKYFDGVSRPSDSVTYQVEGIALLPMATVDNAPGDVFDPDQFTDTVVRIDGTAAGLKRSDEVTAFWSGATPAGTDSRDFLVNTDNQNLSWSITAALIEPSRDDQVQVRYEVLRSAGGQQSSEVRSIQIKGAGTGPVFGDESFESKPLEQLAVNVRLPFANGLFITVMAAVQGSAIVAPGINEFGDRALNCVAGQKIKFEFGGEVSNFGLSHTLTVTTQNRLDFFDGNDVVVQSINLKIVSPGEIALEDVVLAAPCVYCELTVDTIGTMVDNFIWS